MTSGELWKQIQEAERALICLRTAYHAQVLKDANEAHPFQIGQLVEIKTPKGKAWRGFWGGLEIRHGFLERRVWGVNTDGTQSKKSRLHVMPNAKITAI